MYMYAYIYYIHIYVYMYIHTCIYVYIIMYIDYAPLAPSLAPLLHCCSPVQEPKRTSALVVSTLNVEYAG